MLHNNDNDRDLARNQFLALMLLSFLVLVWMYYFMPAPEPRQADPRPEPGITSPEPSTMRAEDQDPYKLGVQRPRSTTAFEEDESWLPLPPVPDAVDPERDEVTLDDGRLRLTFTRIGARLKQATVLLGENGSYDIQLVPASREADTEALYPLGLDFSNAEIGRELNKRRWEVESQSDKAITFALEVPGVAVFRKAFSLDDRPQVLGIEVSYEHLAETPRLLGIDFTPAYHLQWEPQVASMDEQKGIAQSLVWFRDGVVDSVPTGSMTVGADGRPFQREIPEPGWMGVRSAYFVVAMRPEYEQSRAWAAGSPTRFFFGMGAPAFEARTGERVAHEYSVYIGPSQLNYLAEAWPTLPAALQFFTMSGFAWMDSFAKFLLSILHWMYDNVYANYGVAIILLTALVRLVVFPLSLPQMKSAKKMQLLGPEIEKLKEEHKDDPAEMNKAMMALWSERGVNPLGGCLPLFLQFPVFIALYRMLWSAFELRGAEFLWIADLSEPDKLFSIPQLAVVPFIGEYIQHFNLLPILATVTMVISMRFAPGAGANMNPQQKMMMTMMPIVFGLLFYSWASGLNLYVFAVRSSALCRRWSSGGSISKWTSTRRKSRRPRRRNRTFTPQPRLGAARWKKRSSNNAARPGARNPAAAHRRNPSRRVRTHAFR
jgi:YidC/Oxa1 family membrane protein insertase